MSECTDCHRKLTSDEIGIFRKLISRNAERFLCKTCLSDYMQIDETLIDAKIVQFKKIGCQLFAKD